MNRQTLCLMLVAGLATTSQADVLFSFASDTDHTDFTFAGMGSGVSDAEDPSDPVRLLIDDGNGGMIPLTYDVEFGADFDMSYAGSVDLGGGLYVHSYVLDGEFGFYDGSGSPVLTATVTHGALTALGGVASWLSTSTILSADSASSDITYTWHLADNADYGLFTGSSIGPSDDGAFTLTFLQTDGGSGVGLGSDMLPDGQWVSEGSFSGSATFLVPTPGSLALLGGAGLVMFARRRH